jgi:hypothetical protein
MARCTASPSRWRPRRRALLALGLLLWVSCGTLVPRQGWDRHDGLVVPHDTFPADCSLCHTGSDWHTLRDDFAFDHEGETGVPLRGAHADARCLFCHNDRGPVAQFQARGCGGCHEDVHQGQLGSHCAACHDERSWRATGQIELHDRKRFPLVGAHAAVACWRCHEGAQVGNFAGASRNCEACHQADIGRSVVVDHFAQGLTTGCERCHVPVRWLPARI